MNKSGFTLVEISIVMIIIGLLIGGTFGGMKLVENMQVNRTIQDIKAVESAALTFKDTYGRLPGDITNPSTRLPNCTAAPCSTGGNGNRIINFTTWDAALTATDEKFTFWSHLQAADLLAMGTKNTTDMSFGEGQPEGAVSGGFRLFGYNGVFYLANTHSSQNMNLMIGISEPSAVIAGGAQFIASCQQLGSIDQKMDDGLNYNGLFKAWCSLTSNATDVYNPTLTSAAQYDLKGF